VTDTAQTIAGTVPADAVGPADRSDGVTVAGGRRPGWASLPLPVILAVQAALSGRLIFRNTAFLDEADYLSAGRWMLHTWAHGGIDIRFGTFYSGAPCVYPVIGAVLDEAGGLHAARAFSLVCMLVATVACHLTAHELWGRPAGWLAAAAFASTEGTQFLGAFATYDAMALMLMALATWTAVRSAHRPRPNRWMFLAVAVLALANFTAYSSALFDPVVIAVAGLVMVAPLGPRRALATAAAMLAGLASMLAAIAAVVPCDYLTGLLVSTVDRIPATTPPLVVMEDAWFWVGGIAGLAVTATLVAALSARRDRSGRHRVGLLAVLTLAVALAPVDQARIHTLSSLAKHVTFGAWFAAVAVGFVWPGVERTGATVARRSRPSGRRTVALVVAALAVVVPLGVDGAAQADGLDHAWPDLTALFTAMRPLVHADGDVLMDNPDIGRYYLGTLLSAPYWHTTTALEYRPPGGRRTLSGGPAFVAAVSDGAFSVIALDYGHGVADDRIVTAVLRRTHLYAFVGTYLSHDTYGRSRYLLWRIRSGRPDGIRPVA
jgi:hypothetical protein